MRVFLKWNESPDDAARRYFELAKAAKKKKEGAQAALEETRKKLELERAKWERKQAHDATQPAVGAQKIEARKREWFERYRHFTTTHGFLVLGGRDAKQNEALVKRMKPDDWFFHADIQGAPAVILEAQGKPLAELPREDLEETAQFAASYSSAWKRGFGSIDVYAVPGKQTSLSSHGEYVSKGGVVMRGEREWFRNTPLGLRLALRQNKLTVAPERQKMPESIRLAPAAGERKEILEILKKKFTLKNTDALAGLLPGGSQVQP